MTKEISMLYIGRKHSGKTVALHSMYHTMAKGIKIILPDGTVRIHMDQMAEEEKKPHALQGEYRFISCNGKYKRALPTFTRAYSYYKFSLYRNQQSICSVETLDYDGRLIDELDADSPDWAKLETAMKRASAIVYLISGENLLGEWHKWKGETGEQHGGSGSMEDTAGFEADYIRMVIHTIRKIRDGCPPLLFYVTKSELFPENVHVMEVLEHFIQINNLYFPNTIILGCQSALGMDTAISECGDRQIIIDGYEPQGFELPLLLIVGYYFSKSWEKLAAIGLNFLGGLFKGHFSGSMKASAARLEEKRQPVRDILAYIQKGGFSVLYIDTNGKKRDIADLLK
jgi:hypothetical protein